MARGQRIERKYLVVSDGWKRSEIVSVKGFTQGYLTVPGVKNQPEVRVRIASVNGGAGCDSTCTMTIKGKGTLSRTEVEKMLDRNEALELLELCADRILYKTRTCVAVNGKAWEVDVYSGPLAGLVVAELDLSSEGEHVDLPAWIGQEMTEDVRFKNANLAGMRWDGQDLVRSDNFASSRKIKP